MLCVIWHHFNNLKNVKNIHGGVSLLALACNFTNRNTPPSVLFSFFKSFFKFFEYQNLVYGQCLTQAVSLIFKTSISIECLTIVLLKTMSCNFPEFTLLVVFQPLQNYFHVIIKISITLLIDCPVI